MTQDAVMPVPVMAPADVSDVSPIAEPHRTGGWLAVLLVFVIVLGTGGLLRYFDLPRGNELRDVDELGYLRGGAELLEGVSPGQKAAPSGPQFWSEWAFFAARTVRLLTSPGPREIDKPWQLRPFFAVDDAIFQTYRDMTPLHFWVVCLNNAIALLGCAAAAWLGTIYAGWAGGLLVGGLFASWPLFVSFSGQTRPYASAWAFGMMAMCFVARNSTKRNWIWVAAIFLGLAIGSRIDMLSMVPLFWWVYIDRKPVGRRVLQLMGATALAGAVAVFVAPWLVTSLLGEMRTIATVRFSVPPFGRAPWTMSAMDYLVWQGAGIATVIALVAACVQPRGRRMWCVLLLIYWALLFASLLKDRGFGIHQHAEVFLSLLVLLAGTIGGLLARWPRLGLFVLFTAVIAPVVLSAKMAMADRHAYVEDDSVQWVEKHVPAGTTVYVASWMMPSLLPTPESARSLWSEVTDDQAWLKKFRSGLNRFGLNDMDVPRALSEENLVQERSGRRSWFILGGHTELPIPRYDIRLVRQSPVFGVQDLAEALRAHGGIVLWRTPASPPPAELGTPIAKWLNERGDGVAIYCSADVVGSIRP